MMRCDLYVMSGPWNPSRVFRVLGIDFSVRWYQQEGIGWLASIAEMLGR
jgi:hypothetical protein